MAAPDDTVWIASFDIGKINFSFYVEEIDTSKLRELVDIPKKESHNKDGSATPAFEKILTNIYKNGKKILLENVDLTTGCDKSVYLDPETYHNMVDVLDSHAAYWDKCSIFVIEKQMSFRKKYNTMALKLGQHCWSYFAFRYGRFKHIEEFPAYHKTQILGAQKTKVEKRGKIKYKTIDKRKRKKWCIAKAVSIMTERGDAAVVSLIENAKKKDDLSDVICQLQAFKYIAFVRKE